MQYDVRFQQPYLKDKEDFVKYIARKQYGYAKLFHNKVTSIWYLRFQREVSWSKSEDGFVGYAKQQLSMTPFMGRYLRMQKHDILLWHLLCGISQVLERMSNDC